MLGPLSEKSALDIHIAVNVPRELKIEPPIHAKNCLYTGPTTFNFV